MTGRHRTTSPANEIDEETAGAGQRSLGPASKFLRDESPYPGSTLIKRRTRPPVKSKSLRGLTEQL